MGLDVCVLAYGLLMICTGVESLPASSPQELEAKLNSTQLRQELLERFEQPKYGKELFKAMEPCGNACFLRNPKCMDECPSITGVKKVENDTIPTPPKDQAESVACFSKCDPSFWGCIDVCIDVVKKFVREKLTELAPTKYETEKFKAKLSD